MSGGTSVSTRDDLTSLTTFGNPFEEDEADNTSYAIVSSLLSRVKNTFSAQSGASSNASQTHSTNVPSEQPRTVPTKPTVPRLIAARERPSALATSRLPAPPLVSMTPVVSEIPTYIPDSDIPSSRSVDFSYGDPEAAFSNGIPGFPIQDDTRSIRTSNSLKRSGTASKVIRRLRGDGLSKDYWMDDDLCKECYDCKSTFTTWRRKHHCRICGQIYCSRCASNIIKGSRFGQEGVVRVCNLCLKMLEDDSYDDDDDRRSVTSVASSPFPAHQLESVQSAYPQSPFAAQHLLSQSHESFNLFSIPESASHRRVAFGNDTNIDDRSWEEQEATAAPFRRNIDEDKDVVPETGSLDQYISENEASSIPTKPSLTRLNATVTSPSAPLDRKESFIRFPGSSSPDGSDSPRPLRSRVSSFAADGETLAPPFLRSRVHSRLAPPDAGEPGWRTRRESSAYAAELNAVSMFHLRVMLRQLLSRENIPRVKEWEETLLKLSLRVASRLSVNPRAPGASMDVRKYVKIKKIPGGVPGDSEYVDGAVITKNVAHKSMVRDIRNPRIMLVTFPFDYHRVEGQFMSFDPLLAQEKDYLFNLVSRVSALRPHLVLVERTVSRLALEYLLQANIVVARTVKNTALQFVSRATQAQVLPSMDRLVTEPQMGHCSRFRLQTFEHPLIPGRRKTYMRFEGCGSDTACTILLRGEDLETLKKIKAVTSFMMFIVRNLKMETFLWKDTVISMPLMTTEAVPPTFCRSIEQGIGSNHTSVSTSPTKTDDVISLNSYDSTHARDSEVDDSSATHLARAKLSQRIQSSMEPYLSNFISVSATLRFPPPYPIWRMKELDDLVQRLQKEWEDEEAAAILQEETGQIRDLPRPQISEANDPSSAPSEDDLTKTPIQRNNLTLAPEPTEAIPIRQLRHSTSHSSLLSSNSSVASSLGKVPHLLAEPPVTPPGLRNVAEIASQGALHRVRLEHEERRRIWEWYLRKNSDDFVVQKYQCIHVRQFLIPTLGLDLESACHTPKVTRIQYYGENDCTLGQFIEDSVIEALDPKKTCGGKGCRKHLGAHSKVYVHNDSRVVVATEHWIPATNPDSPTPAPDKVASFSVCRVCLQTTPFIPISDEALKYSFGKFLELHFYPADVLLIHGAGCEHNIYLHHIRYFAWHGMTVRFQTVPVEVFEVGFPPMRTAVRLESLLELKNRDYEHLLARNASYWQSVVNRILLVQVQDAKPDSLKEKAMGSKPIDPISDMLQRAELDRQEIVRTIHQAYKDSAPTDTLALGTVRTSIQNKVVQWDIDLEKFEKNIMPPKTRMPSEKDFRRMTGSHHFKRIYDDFFRQYASSASEIDEKVTLPPDPTDNSLTSETESGLVEKVILYTDLGSQAEEVPRDLLDSEAVVSTTTTPSNDDPESDSTISAPHVFESAEDVPAGSSKRGEDEVRGQSVSRYESRLPRWQGHQPSVSDLVKQFQNTRDDENSTVSRTPLNGELNGELETMLGVDTTGDIAHEGPLSNKTQMARRSLGSDFERSYVANVGPRHLTQSRRLHGKPRGASRIPAPIAKTLLPTDEALVSRTANGAMEKKMQRTSFGGGKSNRSILANKPEPKDKRETVTSASKSKGKAVHRSNIHVPPRSSSKPPTRLPISTSNKVSTLTRQFERMSKDSDRANRRYAMMKGRKARPVASARAKVEVFSNIRDAVMDESDESSDSSEADDEDDGDEDTNKNSSLESSDPMVQPNVSTDAAKPAQVDSTNAQDTILETADPTSPSSPTQDTDGNNPLPIVAETTVPAPLSPVEQSMEELLPSMFLPSTSGHGSDTQAEGSSMVSAVASWWRNNNSSMQLQYPFAASEHVFAENSITIREDEPTSIIAFTLNSKDHRQSMSKAKSDRLEKGSDKPEAFMPDDSSDTRSTWGLIDVDEAPDPADLLKHPLPVTHLSFQFESGGADISCIVFCAEQFEALRRSCDCDSTVIQSLARCLKWDASGGKSGSAFLKTRGMLTQGESRINFEDERFIAKELSKSELDAMTKFAPAYFEYMSTAILSNRPTLLAKIFGFYKIAYKNPVLGKTVRMNLLVMENLFYGRRFSKIYDLKGSMRNRHVQSTGRENEVLLDENLAEAAHKQPFYLREHSKRVLRGALWNDSKFLANLNIMDYSVLVAVDSMTSELVVGVVDFIRTYTWDKKLESWVKESAFLGGAAKGEPTIITPKQYRTRFLGAMERYFPMVPDRWTKQIVDPEDEAANALDMWHDW